MGFEVFPVLIGKNHYTIYIIIEIMLAHYIFVFVDFSCEGCSQRLPEPVENTKIVNDIEKISLFDFNAHETDSKLK